MPIYEYYCDKCESTFDEYKLISQRHSARCKCGSDARKLISISIGASVDSTIKDMAGTPIWHPGKPYYDRFLGKSFNTKKEKAEYMKEKRIVMDGSDSPKRWPVESGDMRDKSYRKSVNAE